MKRDLFTPKVGQKVWNCAPDPTCFHVRGIVDDQVVAASLEPA